MFPRIYIPLLLASMQNLVLVESTFSLETCVEAHHAERSTELNCTDGIISDVTVTSGTGKCLQGQGQCLGMTPTVMVAYMNCYWRRECLINWPRDPIIYTEPYGTDRTCVGRSPTFMKISYKCFKPTDCQEEYGFVKSEKDIQTKRLLIDICSNLENGKSTYERTGTANMDMAGIIRSHKIYPWDYSNELRKCSVKLYWPEKQTLVVTVHMLDLSDDDSLTIENDDIRPVNVNSTKTFRFSGGYETKFLLSVGTESNSGKGFLLCFKFISDTDKTVKDACESIMTDGMVTNVEPVTNKEDRLPLHPVTTQTPVTTSTAKQIPPACLKKKTEKRRSRCIKKHERKAQNGRRRKKEKGKRKRNKRKNKNDNRKRRHITRKNLL